MAGRRRNRALEELNEVENIDQEDQEIVIEEDQQVIIPGRNRRMDLKIREIDYENFDAWKKNFLSICMIAEWDDVYIKGQLISALGKFELPDTVEMNNLRIISVEDMLDAIETCYCPRTNYFEELSKIRLTKNMPMREYVTKVNRLCMKVNPTMTAKEKCGYFAKGLPASIANTAKSQAVIVEHNVFRLAQLMEPLLENQYERFQHQKKQDHQKSKFDGKCFRCGMIGHRKQDCKVNLSKN